MAEPILFEVGIEGQDDILKVAEAIGEGLGAAFSKPNADIAKLNASINSLSATITKLGASSVATADQIKGVSDAGAAFEAITDSIEEFQAKLDASTEDVEKFGETIKKLGEESQEAGKHIHELGAAGSLTSQSFGLLKTSVTGAVEVLTGGGISAGLRTVKELGEGAEQTASHFGKIGEAIGSVALRFGLFTAAVGATAAAVLELGTHAAHATLDTINLATVLNQSVAQVVALQRRFIDLGLSEEQAGTVVRTVATQIEESWSSIQKEVRDASENVIKDQLAIAEAGRGVEQAQVGVREAALATADAEEHAATAAGDAARAAAEAQINASEAVIHQKEAEFDAQNKLADAQRAYADAVVSANEAQMNLADAQKDFEYSGDDAWRTMKDAIDAVADAERKAADEASAVQEALLSVEEAATSVKGAYVSLYAAQIAYREAHGERVSRAERQELRREQTEVGLESAQERVRGAEFQYAKTARDAVPEAQERQEKASRSLQASREAEDKASQKYAESSERAADKLERAGSAAASALEHVARAALEVQLAPQKAIDESAQAQLGVEDALANVRKTAYEAAHAQERAEDALETARINQREATDKARLAEFGLTDARNKAIENFSNSIATLQQAARTGRLPEGADPNLIRPESIARAAQATGGGDVRATIEAAQHIAQQLNLSTEKIFALVHELGIQRGAETQQLINAFRPGGQTFFPPPTKEDKDRAETITKGEAGARELIKAERDAAEALNTAAIKWGNLITPEITEFLKQDWWKQAGEIFGVAAALSILQGLGVAGLGALLKGGVKFGAKAFTRGTADVIEGEAVAPATGEAVEITHPTAAPKPTYPTTAEALVEMAPKAPPAAPAAPGPGFISGLAADIGVAFNAAFLPVIQMIQGEASGFKGVKDIQEKAAAERGEKPLTKADLDQMMAEAKKAAGVAPEEKKPEAPKPEPKAEEKPEEKKAATTNLDAAAKKLDEAGVKLIDAAKALTGDKTATAGGSLSEVAAALKEIVAKLSADTAGGGTGGKLDDAATKLDDAAIKLDEAADKISKGGGGDAADLQKAGDKIGEASAHLGDLANKLGAGGPGGPEVRTQEQGDDAIKSIKESIDKLVGEKGLIQPPTDPKERSAYDEAVRRLIDSLTEINGAQKKLIEEQTKATAEGEILTKAQEKLVEAQTALVRAQTAAVEKGEGGGGLAAPSGGGGGGGQAAAGGGGQAAPSSGGGGGGVGGAPSGGGGGFSGVRPAGPGYGAEGAAAGGGPKGEFVRDRFTGETVFHQEGVGGPKPTTPPKGEFVRDRFSGEMVFHQEGVGGPHPTTQPKGEFVRDRFTGETVFHQEGVPQSRFASNKQGNVADYIDREQESADAAFARRSAERKKAFDEAEMKKPPSERQLLFESQQPQQPPPPPPSGSLLRERGSDYPHVPGHDVTTTLPNFDTVVTKLTSSADKQGSAADKLSVVADKLITSETTTVKASTHAAGGMIHAPGVSGDNVPIMATSGEFIVNPASTSKHRSLLEQINDGGELHFQLGGFVGGLNPGLAHEPSTGALQSALTSNIGIGPGGYMMAKMQQSTQSYAVDLRTDHGTYTVLATEDQMGSMLQGSIAQKIVSTGPKPSWWS